MLPQLTAAVLLAQGCYQGFSQKGVQPSYGRPFLEEIQRKFTLSLIILWENMPSGRPVFNFWLNAWMSPWGTCTCTCLCCYMDRWSVGVWKHIIVETCSTDTHLIQTPIYVYNGQFCLSWQKAYIFRDTFLCRESRGTNSRILSTMLYRHLVTCAPSFLVMCP